MAIKHYRSSLSLLLIHATLGVLWNIVSLWLISQGKVSLGPNPTYIAIVLLLFLIIGYILSLKKGYDTIYTFFALIAFIISFYGIATGLTRVHELWFSELWRYVGIAINIFGVVGFIFALNTFTKKRKVSN